MPKSILPSIQRFRAAEAGCTRVSGRLRAQTKGIINFIEIEIVFKSHLQTNNNPTSILVLASGRYPLFLLDKQF